MIRVVVVDDSAIARRVLRAILEADGDIQVVGEAGDGEEGLRQVAALSPDLATIDLAMPGMSGLDAIEQIMARNPIPIVVVTGIQADEDLVFQAVRRGALDLTTKPRLAEGPHLREKVRRLAAVPVVRHIAGSLRPRTPAERPSQEMPLAAVGCRLIGIAASAGGPGAVAKIIGALPASFGACIAVVQHLPMGYAERFARYLAENGPFQVSCIEGAAPARPGTILLPADGLHLVARSGGELAGSDEPPVEGHRPSATVLFRSLANHYGPRAAGVVLSGIGRDGAEGLAELRATGALTIAQDESTSAVYGMPRAAQESGAARVVLPLTDIASALLRAVT